MSVPPEASAEGPVRRRDSWSLKTIVEEVAGRPISELQDPSRPMHPYLKVKLGSSAGPPARGATSPAYLPPRTGEPDGPPDPVSRVYPPLIGATGRALHGDENAHHAETLASVHGPHEAPVPGVHPHPPGPSGRPERIYLHYLLLHLDRLTDVALQYLDHAVREELEHRGRSQAAPASSPSPAPGP